MSLAKPGWIDLTNFERNGPRTLESASIRNFCWRRDNRCMPLRSHHGRRSGCGCDKTVNPVRTRSSSNCSRWDKLGRTLPKLVSSPTLGKENHFQKCLGGGYFRYPFLGGIKLDANVASNFEGFPLQCIVWVGNMMTPVSPISHCFSNLLLQNLSRIGKGHARKSSKTPALWLKFCRLNSLCG